MKRFTYNCVVVVEAEDHSTAQDTLTQEIVDVVNVDGTISGIETVERPMHIKSFALQSVEVLRCEICKGESCTCE